MDNDQDRHIGGRQADILIVDDRPAQLLVYQTILEDIGQTLFTAASGEEAVSMLQRARPDVVLLGLGMRGEKGLETCRKVAALAPDARILVLTTYEKEAERREAYQAGACRYLLKDLHSQELIRAIEGPRITHSEKGGRDD